jgi:hypothetical protein
MGSVCRGLTSSSGRVPPCQDCVHGCSQTRDWGRRRTAGQGGRGDCGERMWKVLRSCCSVCSRWCGCCRVYQFRRVCHFDGRRGPSRNGVNSSRHATKGSREFRTGPGAPLLYIAPSIAASFAVATARAGRARAVSPNFSCASPKVPCPILLESKPLNTRILF